MRAAQPKTFYEYVSLAFSKPTIWEKCRDLSRILPQGTPKELHLIFSQVCGDIFGYPAGGVGYGWNLTCVSRSGGFSGGGGYNYRDFHAALSFLGSSGPLMEAITKLMPDPGHSYDYPTSQMPTSSHYSSAASYSSVRLSAFEYFFYHFANLPVRRQRQNIPTMSSPSSSANGGNADTLYLVLLEDYLSCFLPIEPSLQAKLFTQSFQHSQTQQQQQQQSPPVTSPTGKTSLFRTDFSPRLLLEVSQPTQHSSEMASSQGTTNETWRSDTLVKTLIMFWLEGYVQQDNNGGQQRSTSAVEQQDYLSATLRTASTLPTSELMRVVRMLVKHAHYFANACQTGSVYLPASLKVDIFADRSNKSVLLAYLGRTIDHWPYDASFRLVLETWLSYIQPWRYTNLTVASEDAAAKMEPHRWTSFVSDNYPFYSYLFAKILKRFLRLELASNKNAFMLFRVCKVFGQENFFPTIQRVYSHGQVGSQTGMFSQEVSENIFSEEFKQVICQLLMASVTAIRNENEAQQKLGLEQKQRQEVIDKSGVVSKVVAFVADLFTGDPLSNCNDQVEQAEAEKTIQHLDFVVDKLSGLFHLTDVLAEYNMMGRQSNATMSKEDDEDQTDHHTGLSPAQRKGLLYKKLRPSGTYTGNPDRMPIRSDECAGLVRILYKVSSLVNDKWHDQIEAAYNKEGYAGAFAREFISGPVTFMAHHESDTSVHQLDSSLKSPSCTTRHGVAKKPVQLPPRIVLRTLGSYQFLFYLLIAYFFLMVPMGNTFMATTFLLATYTLIFVAGKALVSPQSTSMCRAESTLLSDTF